MKKEFTMPEVKFVANEPIKTEGTSPAAEPAATPYIATNDPKWWN